MRIIKISFVLVFVFCSILLSSEYITPEWLAVKQSIEQKDEMLIHTFIGNIIRTSNIIAIKVDVHLDFDSKRRFVSVSAIQSKTTEKEQTETKQIADQTVIHLGNFIRNKEIYIILSESIESSAISDIKENVMRLLGPDKVKINIFKVKKRKENFFCTKFISLKDIMLLILLFVVVFFGLRYRIMKKNV